MTFELDGENPPGVLSEVETCRCAPLNQCSDGISMIMYYLSFVILCGIGFMCVCIYYSPHTIQVHFIFLFYALLGHDFLHVYKIIS